MRFDVETRGSILSINPKVPHVIISISDHRGDRQDPPANEFTRDILHVDFHDINMATDGLDLFTDAQAIEILNFYTRYRNETELVVAHCTAGMSRSPAVIAALQKIHTGDDSEWFKKKTPNSYVYNHILSAAYERGLFAG